MLKKLEPLAALPIHPFLWALYPPLALLGHNISQVPPSAALRTLLAALAVAGVLVLLFRPLLGDWHKAAAASAAVVLAFFTYGHVYALIEDRQLFGILIGRHRLLVPVYLAAAAAVILLVRSHRQFKDLTPALNLVGLVMLVLPVFQVLTYDQKAPLDQDYAGDELFSAQTTALLDKLSLPAGEAPPDIYYIILDMYTREDILDTPVGYDNQPFLQALEARGFYVADCSQSNYSSTALSLASSLNFHYLPDLNDRFSPPNQDESDLYPYLWNSLALGAFKQLGYQVVAFESGYSPTELKNADIYYSPITGQHKGLVSLLGQEVTPYEGMVLSTSAAMLIYEYGAYFPESVGYLAFLDAAYIAHRDRMLYQMDRLETLAAAPGPKFVFVHILAPHNPFVFGPNGEFVTRKAPFSLNDDRDVVLKADYFAGYQDEVTYLNQRILKIVDALLDRSETPPVIVLQGDHGIPRLTGQTNAILNAYYLPGGHQGLYPSISPVNTFRLVLNRYFGGVLDLLADEACSSTHQSPFECAPLPDPNPACQSSQGLNNNGGWGLNAQPLRQSSPRP